MLFIWRFALEVSGITNVTLSWTKPPHREVERNVEQGKDSLKTYYLVKLHNYYLLYNYASLNMLALQIRLKFQEYSQ